MSSIALLLGLLVVAYVGSQLMGRTASAYRLPSGGEYLLLGMALGPHALGVFEASSLQAFEPLAAVATSWLTLIIGADYGFQGRRRVSGRGLFLGLCLGGLSFVAIAAAVHEAASRAGLFAGKDLFLLSIAIGLVGCETTRHAVRWVLRRYAADGPLARLIDDAADTDDIVPIVGLAVLVAIADHPNVTVQLAWWQWTLITLGVGGFLGATATALLRGEPRASDGWGVIIGAVLMTVGLARQLGLAAQAATFTLGFALSLLSRHGRELRSMLGRSEQSVLLPTLLLAGGAVSFAQPAAVALLVATALAARALVRWVLAPIFARAAGAPSGLSSALAVGLLPNGALSIAIGLALSNRLHGPIGNFALSVAVGLVLVGEAVGPSALRKALEAAGEIRPDAQPLPERTSIEPEPQS